MRRGSRLVAGLCGAVAVALAGAGAPGAVSRELLVTVGEVTDRGAVVWARAPGPGPVSVELWRLAGAGVRQQLLGEATAETDFTVKLRAPSLSPAARHAYRVTWRAVEVHGTFVTAPESNTPSPVTLLWSGDLGSAGRCRSPVKGYPIFRAMAGRRADFFVFLGDTVYADQRCPTPENVPGSDFQARDLAGFRGKHRYNRADAAVQEFVRATSVYAIWDDHEVRNDFAGPSEPLMPVGRRAFLEYWPIQPPPDEPDRLYRRARWGRLVELFVLDTRQYRSDNQTSDGSAKTMLGAAQREWLLGGLEGSDAVWKLIASSVSLSIPTGRTARDGWANGSTRFDPAGSSTGFEHELAVIVDRMAASRIRNIVWLVADVHRAEVIRHRPRPALVFHELVAGPLSASLGRPGDLDETLRPTRLYGEGGFDNFGELRVTEAGLTVRVVDAEGRIRFETTLAAER